MTEKTALEWLKVLNSWTMLRDEPKKACEMAINALEKQIAKKPNKIERKRDEYGFIYQLGECPLCGKVVSDDRQCCDCRQKLDCSEV